MSAFLPYAYKHVMVRKNELLFTNTKERLIFLQIQEKNRIKLFKY